MVVKAGASLIEIGNYDTFYEKGINFSDKKVLNITKETRDLLPNFPLSVTVPHTLPFDKQVDLAYLSLRILQALLLLYRITIILGKFR